jgi:tRNA(Ile)-lysidine synthase
MMLTKIKETIASYSLLNPGDRVVVAVSGGPDSVCLLDTLHALSAELGISLHVAHLDHCFRGEESAEDALFVEKLARTLGLPVTVGKVDVPAYCRERGLSPQAGARKVRYGFLQQVVRDAGASRLATGHTADDQAETLLMRLLRGAGVSGLSAIPPVRQNIIRPLIEVTREEVLEHLRARGLDFRTDPSNAKQVYTRNRIRMEVLPVLKRFNPRIVGTLAAEAAFLRDEDEAMEAHCAAVAAGIITEDRNAVTVKRPEFLAQLPALRRRLLRKALALAGVDPAGLSLVRTDEALAFMNTARSGRTMHPVRGLCLERQYDRFLIGPAAAANSFSRMLAVPGLTAVPELGLDVELFVAKGATADKDAENYLWQANFDYDKISPYLTLRNRRPGDRFCPSGMGGRHKKLQDFFVDGKVPRLQRDRVPLLCAGENILWLVGLRTDERFLAQQDTKNVLVARIRTAACETPDPRTPGGQR